MSDIIKSVHCISINFTSTISVSYQGDKHNYVLIRITIERKFYSSCILKINLSYDVTS